MPPQHARPIRSETRATLVAAIARGRRWLDQLTIDASINTDRIAEREGCSVRKVNMTISLAFLAPDLVKAGLIRNAKSLKLFFSAMKDVKRK
jgi:site-specific DNA recombinase